MAKLTIFTPNPTDETRDSEVSIFCNGVLYKTVKMGDAPVFDITKHCRVMLLVEGLETNELLINPETDEKIKLQYNDFSKKWAIILTEGNSYEPPRRKPQKETVEPIYNTVPPKSHVPRNSNNNSQSSESKGNYYDGNKSNISVPKGSMFSKMFDVNAGLCILFIIMEIAIIIGGIIAILNNEVEFFAPILWSCVGAALLLYVKFIISGYFYFAAVDKGYTDTTYMVFAFITILFGGILIAALPDRGNGNKSTE